MFPPGRKRCFYCFLSFRRGGNAVFSCFCISARAEMQFLLFFDFPPRRKHCF